MINHFRLRFLPCLALAAAVLVFAGACHREVEKQEKQKRIVVLSPEVAEIIAGLGAIGQIVGITAECDYPPELDQIAQVGNFGSIRKETVLSLKPDIVFTSALEQDALATELDKLGLRVEKVYPRKLDELPTTVLRIGNLIGRESEARALADSLAAFISEMRNETSGKPRPKVYLEIYRNPLMSVSDSSFVGEVIEAAGGDNIFSSLERDYARVDPEDVVAARPDIMICYSQDSLESILARKGWQDIPAIKTRRVYFEKDIDPDLIQRASPRTVEGLRRLHELFGR